MVVALSGESDVNTAGQLRDALLEQVTAGPVRVVVDLSGLRSLDSSGVYALLHAQEALIAGGGTLALACPQPVVARALELMGVDLQVPVYGTVRAGMAGLVWSRLVTGGDDGARSGHGNSSPPGRAC